MWTRQFLRYLFAGLYFIVPIREVARVVVDHLITIKNKQ